VGAHLRARARGPWATDQAARHAGHGPRTRQRGPGVCKPGHRITNTDRPGTQTQTRTRQQLRDQAATGSSCATRAAGSHQAATRQPPGSHRHQVQAARTRQQITAAAAVNQAANNCTRCSNQAANNCKPGSAAHGPGSHRQQLRDANQAAAAHDTRCTFHASRSRHHAAGLAGGHAGQVSRHKPAATIGSRCDTRHKKTRHAAGFGSGERGQVRQAAQQLQPGWPASGRPCPGRRPYRL
jgi:hypothetical protein